MGAFHWRQWATEGITRRTLERFGRAFQHAAKRARTIHFALDGIDDPVQFARLGRMGFLRDAMGRSVNFTAAELYIISRNKELLKKTVFYRNGQVVPSPF